MRRILAVGHLIHRRSAVVKVAVLALRRPASIAVLALRGVDPGRRGVLADAGLRIIRVTLVSSSTSLRWRVVRLAVVVAGGRRRHAAGDRGVIERLAAVKRLGAGIAAIELARRRNPRADGVIRLLVPELVLVVVPRLEGDNLGVELALVLEA